MKHPETLGSPDVSIVVVSYNSGHVLGRCLEAVRAASDGLATELFVVDNASRDGSAELVRSRFPEARLIANTENLGFGRANNQAIARASGRYVLLLNPDTEPAPDAIRALVRFADANPTAGIIGGRLENADGSHQHSAFRFPDLAQALFGFFDTIVPLDSRHNGRHSPTRYQRPFVAEHLLGACLLIRRAALDGVGAFDPAYFMYFEETDLCARMRRAGWRNLYTPDARVRHVGASSTSAPEVKERMSVEFHRSQARWYRTHRGWAGYVTLKAIVWAGVAYRLARSLRAYARGRIDGALLRERLDGYWRILWF